MNPESSTRYRGDRQPRRRSNWEGLLGAGLALAIVLSSLAAFLYVIYPPAFYPQPDFPRLEAQGETLVTAIERYHSLHGSYPKELKDAGVAAPKTRWGNWEYAIIPGGGYKLNVGKYDRHGFTLIKRPGRDWYRDT
jgi:hypothetical protein